VIPRAKRRCSQPDTSRRAPLGGRSRCGSGVGRLEKAVVRQAGIDGAQLGADGAHLRRQQLIPQRVLGVPQPQHRQPREKECGIGPRRSRMGISSPVSRIGDSSWFRQFDSLHGLGIPSILHASYPRNPYFTWVCGHVLHGELS